MRKPKNIAPPPAPYTPSGYAKYLPTPDDSLRTVGAKSAELVSELNGVDREIDRLEEALKGQKEKRAALGVVRHLATVLPGPRTISLPRVIEDPKGLCDALVKDLGHLGWSANEGAFGPEIQIELKGPKA